MSWVLDHTQGFMQEYFDSYLTYKISNKCDLSVLTQTKLSLKKLGK